MRRRGRAPRAPGRRGRGAGWPRAAVALGASMRSPAAPRFPGATGAPSPLYPTLRAGAEETPRAVPAPTRASEFGRRRRERPDGILGPVSSLRLESVGIHSRQEVEMLGRPSVLSLRAVVVAFTFWTQELHLLPALGQL